MADQPVFQIFDAIAPTYDRTNRILSGGIDLYWRRKMASLLPPAEKIKLLDLATGTGDQLLSLLKNSPRIHQAVGIDLAEGMLNIGRTKLKSYADRVTLKKASATAIPYLENTFECATMSFGIRNVDNVPGCLREIHRVLRPNGRALILEFSLPTNKWVQKTYLLYLNKLLPHIGRLISAHEIAYTYLARTIQAFPQAGAFCKLMEEAGFRSVKANPLTLGIVTIYQGEK
ncbi:MAG TPA: bifunctional demethylmenaquinone methyltransferase/2-methoxy-6-polyprenyl-1,4-benzoquinol methylase UbiE [Rhabdochlamydiaceae bacterium]